MQILIQHGRGRWIGWTALLVWLVLWHPVPSSGVTISMPLTTEENTFELSSSTASVVAPSPGTFDYNFGELGDVEFDLVWRAPAGYRFLIETPADASGAGFEVTYEGGGFFSPGGEFADFSASGVPVDVVGASSMKSPIFSGASLSGSDPFGSVTNYRYVFRAEFSLTPGEEFSFESMSMSVTVPASYQNDFDSIPVEIYGVRGFASFFGPDQTDPGQWISLAPIPEPGSMVLSLIGLAGVAWLIRRRTLKCAAR